MRKHSNNKVSVLIFWSLFFLVEELVFSIFVLNTFQGFIFKLIFSVMAGIVAYLLTGIFNKKGNNIVAITMSFLTVFIFASQMVYFKLYQSVISIVSMTNGGQVFQFFDEIAEQLKINWYVIVFMLIPFGILITLLVKNKIDFKQQQAKERIEKIIVMVGLHLISLLLVLIIPTNSIYKPRELYFDIHSPLHTASTFGIVTEMRIDFQRLIFGFEEKTVISDGGDEPEPTPMGETGANVLDIDFDSLIANETNEDVKKIHEYVKNADASNKNIYTGMFEGKNLIVFVGEAFSSLGIREDVTPTLYKLYKEGFQFDNFYTPVFPVSTADGEYITDTSLIPKEGVWSTKRLENHYMPFSYANMFEALGYSSNAYHDHTYTYYNRDKYIDALGFNSYLAKGNGLEERMNCNYWPNSDYEMIKATTQDYINNDHFVAYYMTVSGHLYYTRQGNMMVQWNWDKVKDLPYSEPARCYLATQIELDKALAELLTRLETAGKLEDTVIAITGDHYPYGLTLDEINELSTYERDDVFEKYRMPFILWSGSMKEPIKVDKIGSSLDVLPTILNLFGADYDSRLLMGRDILSDTSPLVIYSNRSFITDKGRYNARTNKFVVNEGEEVEDGYVRKIVNLINNKYAISRLILETDYYRYLGF